MSQRKVKKRAAMDPYNAVYIVDNEGTDIAMKVCGAIPTLRECNRMIKALQNVQEMGAYQVRKINKGLPLGRMMDERKGRKS